MEYRIRTALGASVAEERESAAVFAAQLIEAGSLQVGVEQADDGNVVLQRTVKVDANLTAQAAELIEAARKFWRTLEGDEPGPTRPSRKDRSPRRPPA